MDDPFSPARVSKIDSMRVHSTYERWPALARDGFSANVELHESRVKKAFILGMGGSASGGDIVAGWLSDRPGIQVAVFKGQLPIGDLSDAIAVACSASGQTEETVRMLRLAVERKASVLTISGGGKIKEVSESLGVPHVDMPKVIAPRYSLPFLVFSVLAVLNRGMGLACEDEAEKAFAAMEDEGKEIGLAVPLENNSAKRLALPLLQKIPSIYAARVTRGVGIRFKNVLNENAKKHSHFDGVPDIFHNEIEAWQDPTTDILPIFLRHSSEEERDREREDHMVEMLSKMGKDPVQVRGRGSSALGQLASMMYRLDMASYYTAIGLWRDPYVTKLLDALKKAR